MLAVITVAAFYRTLGNGFVVAYDDGDYIVRNQSLRLGLSPKGIVWAFTAMLYGNWDPLTWISHLADYQLYGLNPAGHHATSLLIHTANVILLYLFLRRATARLGSRGSEWKSALVAALFAVHPLRVESVAWVAERKDVLSTLFWILTMWAHVRFVERPNVRRRLAVIGLFALGLMAKPMLVTLPFVLLLLDYWPLRRLRSANSKSGQGLLQLVWEKAPLFVMSGISCVVTVLAQRAAYALALNTVLPLQWRIGNALISYITYLWKMVWPVKLAVLYPWHENGISYPHAVGCALLLIVITFVILKLARRRPYLAFGWLWYLGTLIPVIGLVQIGEQAMADRFTYVPLIGIFVIAAWLAGEWDDGAMGKWGKKALPVMATIIIAVLMVSSWVYVGYWHDQIGLFERATKVTEDNYTAHFNLGVMYYREERWPESISHYQQAIAIAPYDYQAHHNFAVTLYYAGDYAEAWREVHICEGLGHRMQPALLNLLSAHMLDPG